MPYFDSAFHHIERYLLQKREEFHSPGLAVALTSRETLLHQIALGFSDLEGRIPLAPAHRFAIGSITKSFTSIALLQLAEQGRLDLHAPVAGILPIFQVQSRFKPITPFHLMSHTAGITSGTDLRTDGQYEVWALRQTEAAVPPGETFHYCNVGYRALGLLLEKCSGKTCGQAIQTAVLTPLEMAASEPVLSTAARRRMAVGYVDEYDDRPYLPGRPLVRAPWAESFTGEGSLVSTASDLAIYLRMLLNRGMGPHGPVLSPESFSRLIEPVIEDPAHGNFYGLGLRTHQRAGRTILSHTGGMIGYVSAIQGDLELGVGVVVLINGPGDPAEIAEYCLGCLTAAAGEESMPALSPLRDPFEVKSPGIYAGVYSSTRGSLTFRADGGKLYYSGVEEEILLEPRGPDRFYLDHDPFRGYLLRFERRGKDWMLVNHGPDQYLRSDVPVQPASYPQGWDAYPGHYRSHNPWFPSFRIVIRAGELVLITPDGDEELLVELGPECFRVGKDPYSPERITFDAREAGHCLHAKISGGDFYRSREAGEESIA